MKPVLKLYRGYANNQELIVMGHIFKPTTSANYDFQQKNFKNAQSIIRLFQVKTKSNADVYLELNGEVIHTRTLEDGYFKFCVPIKEATDFGWKNYTVYITHEKEKIEATGSYIKPNIGKFGFISDIDDTFLISHTRNPLKKLYILLFKNVNKRKIFEDVVPHYQALQTAGRNDKNQENAFFYVSSSEWNLYRLITQFSIIHSLPKAVLLLKDIKTSLSQFFFTGRGNHNHKFEKIKHILEFYPDLQYVLLGDDSQHDPKLYEAICKIFPLHIKAVYIRQVGKHQKTATLNILENMNSLDVATCYFKSSKEAITHSKEIGLIE
ncbi:App1 family protein [Flavobacterium jejuense]|uniref:App1 family protein n=1 Tax=Flavobacterium jejuense TaxID=1544455 RepID=A0ABX0ITI9_9FLAO|nr:App1 family protein [Flavobacterium jejuense]NHN26536.1 App1 family protein [Flavobacterium jejuense]